MSNEKEQPVNAGKGDGHKRINGTSGNDFIQEVEHQSYYVDTGAGNDTVSLTDGDDIIYTWAGDDVIYAGSGNNVIEAGAGDDYISFNRWETGKDFVTGGAGNDTFNIYTAPQSVKNGKEIEIGDFSKGDKVGFSQEGSVKFTLGKNGHLTAVFTAAKDNSIAKVDLGVVDQNKLQVTTDLNAAHSKETVIVFKP